jgi:hypothetical protein
VAAASYDRLRTAPTRFAEGGRHRLVSSAGKHSTRVTRYDSLTRIVSHDVAARGTRYTPIHDALLIGVIVQRPPQEFGSAERPSSAEQVRAVVDQDVTVDEGVSR